jgi:opacity protein-like surface antigen
MSRLLRLLSLLTLATASAQAAPAVPADQAALEAKVDALASALNQLTESLHVPTNETQRSRFGLGPAASKVYATDGLSIGGYGEFFLGHYLGDAETRPAHRADTYRFITYLGYKFSDMVVFNTELEFEHATTGANPENGKGGSVSVEFMYLDLLLHRAANLRFGLMLMPMGIINEMHEPTTYRGNFRPEVERRIIPSTWRETGLGIFGEPVEGLAYKLFLVSGLSAQGFGDKGLRGGRQKGNHVVWEDKGIVGRLDYRHELFDLGASAYYGGADQDRTEETEITTLVWEAHAQFHWRNLEVRGLFAQSRIDGADAAVPERSSGYYVETSYDVLPHLSPAAAVDYTLRPFVRFEQMNLNDQMASGVEAALKLDTTEITGGLEFNPHPNVVLKLEFAHQSTADDAIEAVDEVRLGGGFIY